MRQLIDSTRLDQWFAPRNRVGQGVLPHVVRRLIRSTVGFEDLKELRIPVGDEVNLPGFDGVVVSAVGHNFLAQGRSIWEVGVPDPARKASSDYTRRTKQITAAERARTTFVFVTPHHWAGKHAWIKERKRRGRGGWADVRVIDAVDLADWLETSPAVSRWLARQMGIPVDGLRDIEEFWAELSATYGFRLSPDLVIGGRTQAATRLREWFGGDSGEITVGGESVEEVCAFAAAVISSTQGGNLEYLSSRAIVADQAAAVDFMAAAPTMQFLIVASSEARRRFKAIRASALRGVVPIVEGAGGEFIRPSIALGRVKRAAVREALIGLGRTEAEADRIAQSSKGSLTAALWLGADGPDVPLAWTQPVAASELAPILLAGQWMAEEGQDKQLVARLAARPYTDIEHTLMQWSTPTGPLVRRGEVWDWRAADFVWRALDKRIDSKLLKRFDGIIREVLSLPDPAVELPPDERWLGRVRGKVHPYSDVVRAGVVGSLARLSTLESEGAVERTAIVERAIKYLLHSTDSPRAISWMSLARWLPDLAEAAPDAFLFAVQDLVHDEEALKAMFIEAGMFGDNPHVYLLWAVERLLWSSRHFGDAVRVLADLAAKDPGGDLRNRPMSSLIEALLPWYPQGAADDSARLEAIDDVYSRQGEVGWRLARALLPGTTTTAFSLARPRWRRNWVGRDGTATNEPEFVTQIVLRLLSWAGASGQRWSNLVAVYPNLVRWGAKPAELITTALAGLKVDAIQPSERRFVYESARELVTRHSEFPDESWAITPGHLRPIEELVSRFEELAPAQRHRWLFTSWPTLPGERSRNHVDEWERIDEARREALGQILSADGIAGLLAFGASVDNPFSVGWALGGLNPARSVETELLDAALAIEPVWRDPQPLWTCGLAYVARSFKDRGEGWLKELEVLGSSGWPPNKLANLALGLPKAGPTWDRVDKWGTEAAKLYWSRVDLAHVENPSRDLRRGTDCLLHAKRPHQAVHMLGLFAHGRVQDLCRNVPREVVAAALIEAAGSDPREEAFFGHLRSTSYIVEGLINAVEHAGLPESEVADLEWRWLQVIEDSKRGPKLLQRQIASRPELFVELLTMVFRAENEAAEAVTRDKEAAARRAFRLLEALTTLPGTSEPRPIEKPEEGDIVFPFATVDKDSLDRWVDRARALAKGCGRLGVCDSQIGQLLAYSPVDPDDGLWPSIPVRDLIGRISSEDLERGMSIGVYNKRGAHMRAPGGAQERKLATKFRAFADGMRRKWPRAARITEGIAKHFEWEADRQDKEAAQEEFQ